MKHLFLLAAAILLTGSVVIADHPVEIEPDPPSPPPQTYIPCGTDSYWLTTGTASFTLSQLPDSSWVLYDGQGNEARMTCQNEVGCLSTQLMGGCYSSSAGLYAELDVDCPNGNTYTLKTGNNNGSCTVEISATGGTTGGSCSDGGGNGASASCSPNGGDGSCTGSSGSGSCSCKTCK